MPEERQATTVRLTRSQLKWIRDAAFEWRCRQQDVIEAALIVIGAPRDAEREALRQMIEQIRSKRI